MRSRILWRDTLTNHTALSLFDSRTFANPFPMPLLAIIYVRDRNNRDASSIDTAGTVQVISPLDRHRSESDDRADSRHTLHVMHRFA